MSHKGAKIRLARRGESASRAARAVRITSFSPLLPVIRLSISCCFCELVRIEKSNGGKASRAGERDRGSLPVSPNPPPVTSPLDLASSTACAAVWGLRRPRAVCKRMLGRGVLEVLLNWVLLTLLAVL